MAYVWRVRLQTQFSDLNSRSSGEYLCVAFVGASGVSVYPGTFTPDQ